MSALCFLAITTPLKAAERLPLATGEWLPYTSESLEGGGVLVELIRAVVVDMGMEPDFSFLPWKRAEKNVERGNTFAAFPYGKNAERKSRFDFSEIFFSTPMVFFYRRNDLPITDFKQLEDLSSYRIGGNLGYSYVPRLQKAGLDLHLTVSQEQLILMLEKKRVDLVALDRGAGWMIINRLFPKRRNQFATMKQSLNRNAEEFGSYLMVSRMYPHHSILLARFNKSLANIKRDGTYDKIMTKFHMQDGGAATSEPGS